MPDIITPNPSAHAAERTGLLLRAYPDAVSQDAYSPLTGRWGVEGLWDVVVVGLVIAALALVVLSLAKSRQERALAVLAMLFLIPAYLGVGWLGDVQVNGPDGDGTSCLLRGPVDTGTECGAAYLDRYAALMVPLTILLIALACILAYQLRSRFRGRTTTAP